MTAAVAVAGVADRARVAPMKLVVCINPTTGGAVDASDAAIRAGNAKLSNLRPCDAHAVEQALRIAEHHRQVGGAAVEIVAVTLGPVEALGALREALALGAHRAVLCDDATVRDLDTATLASVLAALLASEPADLYLACSWSGDIDELLLLTIAGAAARLPVLTQAGAMSLSETTVEIRRQSERGDQVVSAPLPCLVEVTATINQARYPTLKGRAAAQNKPVTLVRPAMLGIDVGGLTPRVRVVDVGAPAPVRQAEVIDDPVNAPERIVEFLERRRLL